jgi:hypothetical protein
MEKILPFFCVLVVNTCFGQTFIGVGGNTITNNSGSISFSIGEALLRMGRLAQLFTFFLQRMHPYRNVQSSHVKGFSKARDMLLVIGVGRREARSCKVMHFVMQRVSCRACVQVSASSACAVFA